jgi:hypothetical protein
MIVHNLHVVGVSASPHKANAPLIVDSDAVLSRAAPFERFKPIAGKRSQINQSFRCVQHQQFPSRRLSNVRKPWNILVVEKSLRVSALVRLYHT